MTTEYEDTSSLDDFIATPTTAPVPEAAPAAPANPEPELPLGEAEAVETTVETTGDEAQPEKKGRTTQERIKKLTADMRHYERGYQREAEEVAALRARLATYESPALTNPAPSNTVPVSSAPDPEKYQYGELDPRYMEALADYRADIRIEAYEAKRAKEAEESQRRSAADRETAQLREKADSIGQAGVAKFKDFQEVVVDAAQRGEYALTKEMFEMAAETSVAPEILYHLASNPEESAQVASLPPLQQALWFARQETRLSTPAAPPVRAISQAPEPIASTRGSGSRATTSPDTDDLEAFGRLYFQR